MTSARGAVCCGLVVLLALASACEQRGTRARERVGWRLGPADFSVAPEGMRRPPVVAIGDHLGDISSIPMLTEAVQRGFAGVLLIVLGLELLETLRMYFAHHRVRLEIILVVAIIAVARHVINLDFHDLSGAEIAGVGALILALTGGYYLVKKSGGEPAD